MLIRMSLIAFATVAVAMTSAVDPASAKLKCTKWMPLTQSQRCVRWSVVPGPDTPTKLPKDDKGNKKPCNFGQKC
jgi:hypothetical protein